MSISVGAYAAQTGKNLALNPLWGANQKYPDGTSARSWQQGADWTEIGAGAAGLGVGTKLAVDTFGKDIGWGMRRLLPMAGAAYAGAVAVAGVVNLLGGGQGSHSTGGSSPKPPTTGTPPPNNGSAPPAPPSSGGTTPPDTGSPVPSGGNAPGTQPGQPTQPGNPTQPGDPTQGQNPVQQGPSYYTVQRGDYLTHIAQCTHRTWQQLYAANRDAIGSNPDYIPGSLIGKQLVVPSQDAPSPTVNYTPLYPGGVQTPGLQCGAQTCTTSGSN